MGSSPSHRTSSQSVGEGVASWAEGLPGPSLGSGSPLAVPAVRRTVLDAVLQKRLLDEPWDPMRRHGVL